MREDNKVWWSETLHFTTSVHSSMSELNMCQTVMNMKPLYSPYPELRLLSEFVLPLIEFVLSLIEFVLPLSEFAFFLKMNSFCL
jgi:hypothetical protein